MDNSVLSRVDRPECRGRRVDGTRQVARMAALEIGVITHLN
jgi:hypothetical protein